MHKIFRLIMFFAVLESALCSLGPEQVLVITNSSSGVSEKIAQYYAAKRKIPADNILSLDLKNASEENVTRKQYKELIRIPVRDHIAENPNRYKCIVTTYGIPYKIRPAGRMPQSYASDQTVAQLNKLMDEKSKQMLDISNRLLEIHKGSGPGPYTSWRKAVSSSESDFEKAYQQLAGSSDRKSLPGDWLNMYIRVFGQGQSWEKAKQLGISFQVSTSDKVVVAELVRFIKNTDSQQWDLNRRLEKGYYSALEKAGGLKALLNCIDMHLAQAGGKETHASVDSELSMVMFDEYPLYRWQPNELKNMIFWFNTKTVMVSRLDGPSLEIIKSIIDKSIQAEGKLAGKVYVDMRYSSHSGSSLYVTYDKSLKEMADKIRTNSSLKVIENMDSSLFPPGSCPDAALYCGWYSLKKYIDAFDFVPGAVGYHIASFEAMDIRKPESGQWVPSMLADGITATLGPVAEPYLSAFPKPDEFFNQLLKGDCLAEAYYKTKPFNSWQMLLIGDPLYRPF